MIKKTTFEERISIERLSWIMQVSLAEKKGIISRNIQLKWSFRLKLTTAQGILFYTA